MQNLGDLRQYLHEEYWHQEDSVQMELHEIQKGEKTTGD